MWWCEWLGDVSLPANISLSPSINRPWATAESTSLREKGSERNETQQGAGPCPAVSLSLDVTAATRGTRLGYPVPGLRERLSREGTPGWVIPQNLQELSSAHLTQGNTWALLGNALWPHEVGSEHWHPVPAHEPAKSVLWYNLRKLWPTWDCYIAKINNETPYKCVYLRYSHLWFQVTASQPRGRHRDGKPWVLLGLLWSLIVIGSEGNKGWDVNVDWTWQGPWQITT